jgi:hypothetical protein
MFKHTLDGSQRFIRPAAEAVGPLHPVRNLTDRYGIDRLSDDALLDDFQVGLLAGRSPMTIK